MLSKKQIKLIKSLTQKKYRSQHQMFIVEGIKSISEFLESGYFCESLFSVSDDLLKNYNPILISEAQLKQISQLKSPNKALAIFKIKTTKALNKSKLIVALDSVNDPGNMGTIIRLCDWFGVEDLVCSEETVDCYNPKVVQASMGSLSRVNIHYVNLEKFLEKCNLPIYGTFLSGTNIYQTKFNGEGVLLMGNEANGISDSVAKYITKKITIPQFGNQQKTESLNVATATAICLSQIKQSTET
jgi:TrmH family RNA methyltransferase